MPIIHPPPRGLEWLQGETPHKELARLRASGALRKLLPEVDALYGIPQTPEHHPEVDTGIHIELTLEAAALLSNDPAVRFAALVHDLGKALTPRHELPQHIDHERTGLKPVATVCDRFDVPADWRELALLVCEHHLSVHRSFEMAARSVVRLFDSARLLDSPQLIEPFLLAVESDKRGRAGRLNAAYPQAAYLREAFAALARMPMPKSAAQVSREWQVAHMQRVATVEPIRKRHLHAKAAVLN
jgi:tRNA nucleotidyltransferase (CCA-adding enzyme)